LTRLPRLLFVAVLAALALSVSSTPASAKGPACWARVIADWYDNGRMDHDYPISCYQQALQHLPQDIREYADAQDVIGRALTAAIARRGQSVHTSSTPTTTDKNGKGGGAIVVNPGGGDGGPGPTAVAPTGDNGSGGKSLFAKAFDRLGPGNANSIPIPLIVLGSLALLLLAAGAAGMVARRLQERQPKPATVPQRTTPDGPAV
jgi:hypothetical protein